MTHERSGPILSTMDIENEIDTEIDTEKDSDDKSDVTPERARDVWPLPTDFSNIIPFSEIQSSGQERELENHADDGIENGGEDEAEIVGDSELAVDERR